MTWTWPHDVFRNLQVSERKSCVEQSTGCLFRELVPNESSGFGRFPMLIGHARVSTTGQKLEARIEQLRNAGCERIHLEKRTGYGRKRVRLERVLSDISDADTLIVTSLDRLARSTHDLLEITRSSEAQGANFKSLREPWADTTSPTGKFLLTVFSGLSELERNLVKDRTGVGRQSARKRGVRFGRKPKLTTHQRSEVARMLNEGRSIRSIARHFNVGVATIDRIKKAQSVPI